MGMPHEPGHSTDYRFARADFVHLGAIVVSAVAARVLVLRSLAHLPWFDHPNVDPATYHTLAHIFADGDPLIGAEPLRMSPAYPFLLGVIYRVFGDGVWPVRLIQAAFGVGLVVLTWDATRRLMGRNGALVGGVLTALFGPAMFYEAQLLGDAPAAALTALALWGMVRLMTAGDARPSHWLCVALVTGAIVTLRPNALLLAVPLTLAATRIGAGGAPRNRRLAACAIGFVIGLSFVPVRNALATGWPTPIAAHGGINLFIGNGPDANGTYHVPAELKGATGPIEVMDMAQSIAERDLGGPVDTLTADRYWVLRTARFMRDHPRHTATMLWRKLRLFWTGASTSDIEHYDFTRTLGGALAWPFVQWWPLMLLAIPGTILALRAYGEPIAIVALVNLAWCAGLVAVFVVDRYRLTALPGLAMTAAFFVVHAARTLRRGSAGARVVLAVLAAGAVLASWPVGVVVDRAAGWTRLGATYERAGRTDEARDAYRRALTLAPDNVEARRRLARLR
jgi:4-amino-4-deoxy-L-arabinose transferase-like glycosyltransferase